MLEINEISKKYGLTYAVDNVSLLVKEGEFYALLGPNGAGKTTTITMASGILQPDGGEIYIGGNKIYPTSAATKRKMGIVPQEIALYDELSALENLLFWGSLYGIRKLEGKKIALNLLRLMSLEDRKDEPIKSYSGGMKRRVNIAASLMHNPPLLIMDEPTVGIDPQSRNKIYEVLQQLHHEGKTIVYTTHYMEEAEKMCDRIGIIDKGKIIAEGTLKELKFKSGIDEQIKITFFETNHQLQFLETWAGFYSLVENEVTISTKMLHKDLPQLVMQFAEASIQIKHIDISTIGLEAIFLHLTGRQLRD